MTKIAFYDHHGGPRAKLGDMLGDFATTTLVSTMTEMGVNVKHYLGCMCSHGLDMSRTPDTVIVNPSYSDSDCWIALKDEIENNPQTRFYVTVLEPNDPEASPLKIMADIKNIIGEHPNLSYLDYPRFIETTAELAGQYGK